MEMKFHPMTIFWNIILPLTQMSKLPTLTSRQIITILESKGFLLDRIKGSHHIFYNTALNKRVVVPFHRKDLPLGTMMEILRQAGITKEELAEFLQQ